MPSIYLILRKNDAMFVSEREFDTHLELEAYEESLSDEDCFDYSLDPDEARLLAESHEAQIRSPWKPDRIIL